MACMTPASKGLRISIDDPEAKAFRAGVIEWLMENHPHACPICDEGGECHLQDMQVAPGIPEEAVRAGPSRAMQAVRLFPLVGFPITRDEFEVNREFDGSLQQPLRQGSSQDVGEIRLPRLHLPLGEGPRTVCA